MIAKRGYDQNRLSRPCWNKDHQTQALRVELSHGSSYVFPYRRLAFARFEPGNDHDTLHVLLDTHQIQITGKHLREVLLAIQRFAVDWVRELPSRYAPQADDDHAWITSITISEPQR
ncbi:MAG TPA: hypothetical protein VL171_14045 [Verrucomicrobiae bacterium]|nr:hypothetical protein [Verrucomicrobiae bacterium]